MHRNCTVIPSSCHRTQLHLPLGLALHPTNNASKSNRMSHLRTRIGLLAQQPRRLSKGDRRIGAARPHGHQPLTPRKARGRATLEPSIYSTSTVRNPQHIKHLLLEYLGFFYLGRGLRAPSPMCTLTEDQLMSAQDRGRSLTSAVTQAVADW